MLLINCKNFPSDSHMTVKLWWTSEADLPGDVHTTPTHTLLVLYLITREQDPYKSSIYPSSLLLCLV